MNVASSTVLATETATPEGVVAAGAYVDGRRVANIAIDEASSWRSRPGHVVWIGLHEPDIALLTSVQQQFQLHDLAIEDADHAHQRPKIEQYGDGLFIVARTAQLDGDSIAFGETVVHSYVDQDRDRPVPSRTVFEEISGGAWVGTVLLSVVLAIGLFFLVPVGITSLIKDQLGSSFTGEHLGRAGGPVRVGADEAG